MRYEAFPDAAAQRGDCYVRRNLTTKSTDDVYENL